MLFVLGGYDSLGDGRRWVSPPFECDEDYKGDEKRCTHSWEETEPFCSRSSPISFDKAGDDILHSTDVIPGQNCEGNGANGADKKLDKISGGDAPQTRGSGVGQGDRQYGPQK